ncbi:DNA polymerase subunit gamma-1-like [Amphiura filiformis]|uniref:DNA polymerase subunit gamma-1-like n=1 Tax=Amphiura filiformis TaxID=82378 RepID=UPI003B214E6B
MAARLNLSAKLRTFLTKVHSNNTTVRSIYPGVCSHCCSTHSNENQPGIRKNPIGIQMLSESLHKQIFHNNHEISGSDGAEKRIKKSKKHLQKHGLLDKEHTPLPDVDLKLPNLYGDNIDEHFRTLAKKYSAGYLKLSEELAGAELPPMPSKWLFQNGWVKYVEGMEPASVKYPEEQAIVFDVEVCMTEGPYPTLATAVSTKAWYSWCSGRLIEDQFSLSDPSHITIQDLIPLEPGRRAGKLAQPGESQEKIVVGHNVSFDRSYVKEQYYLQGTKTRFVDTLSLHMATSGLTTLQRKLWNASEKGKGIGDKRVKEFTSRQRNRGGSGNGDLQQDWMTLSSLNNLADVYALYSNGETLDKSERETFITGTITDVRQQFQELVTYCAKDVVATHFVFKEILPIYFERFPHPVTFAAMLEMGQAYLPVNHNWSRYINESEATYNTLCKEMKLYLMRIAKDACSFMHNERYKKDLWLWDLDWEVMKYKLNKPKSLTKAEKKRLEAEALEQDVEGEEDPVEDRIQQVLATATRVPKRWQHMPEYPKWYKDLCPRWNSDDWAPGPSKITSQVRVAPKLMRLTWDGYPLHYSDKERWGFLVPKAGKQRRKNGKGDVASDNEFVLSEEEMENKEEIQADEDKEEVKVKPVFPVREFGSFLREVKKKAKEEAKKVHTMHRGSRAYDIGIDNCDFHRLPHKDGPSNMVGNPLSQDFLNKMEDGTLASEGGTEAQRILEINVLISFWRNAKKRIMSQLVGNLEKRDLPRAVTTNSNYDEASFYGAIVPRVIVSGTMTRRGVEPTWLTASNALPHRVGSELKAMVQTPPGYHFVGADVDSQELWIAALIGDAYFAGFHGCTAFGWMNLAGKKSDETDLHSVTARNADISRNHAKVINYARIYGAGERFATRLLKQFNYQMSYDQCVSKAQKMMKSTKGTRVFRLTGEGKNLINGNTSNGREEDDDAGSDSWVSADGLKKLKKVSKKKGEIGESITDVQHWVGGTESSMFNALEKIANSPSPKTPVLDCCISRALEPQSVGEDFMNSRINWVVQSSAVDYLHLMLVCMRWLFDEYGIEGRFCISIHDEVRYLVKSNDRYRAALALQITNLLTRSMFAYKMKMDDLPQSVAFFSAVDIDTVLRKEVTMDCQTPSNPHGLERGYGIPQGEALDIHEILEKTNSSLSSRNQPKLPEKEPDAMSEATASG